MSERPRVVIVGAGFGGLAAARRLENEEVEITIVDRNNFHTFQPLLYQVATAGLNTADVAYVIRGVFQRHQHVSFRQGSVTGVDWDQRRLQLGDESTLPFDHLIVAAGAVANFFGTPGAEEHGFPLYSLRDAARLRNHVLRRFEETDRRPELLDDGMLNFVVVGGGPTGVEVAGALAELIENVLAKDFHTLDAYRARVILIEAGDVLLAPFSRRSQDYARRMLSRRGVDLRLGEMVEEVDSEKVRLKGGEVILSRTLVWAAGIRASPLAAALDAEQGRGGRVSVDSDLAIRGHEGAYAIGDIADIDDGRGGRLPQLAQVAIQGGRHAAEQILARIDGRPTRPFHYVDKGTMATIGRRAAVAELPQGPKLTGPVAWVAWLFLHLVYLLGMRNRVSVLVNWAWNYLTWERGPRLIFEGAGTDGEPDHDKLVL